MKKIKEYTKQDLEDICNNCDNFIGKSKYLNCDWYIGKVCDKEEVWIAVIKNAIVTYDYTDKASKWSPIDLGSYLSLNNDSYDDIDNYILSVEEVFLVFFIFISSICYQYSNLSNNNMYEILLGMTPFIWERSDTNLLVPATKGIIWMWLELVREFNVFESLRNIKSLDVFSSDQAFEIVLRFLDYNWRNFESDVMGIMQKIENHSFDTPKIDDIEKTEEIEKMWRASIMKAKEFKMKPFKEMVGEYDISVKE